MAQNTGVGCRLLYTPADVLAVEGGGAVDEQLAYASGGAYLIKRDGEVMVVDQDSTVTGQYSLTSAAAAAAGGGGAGGDINLNSGNKGAGPSASSPLRRHASHSSRSSDVSSHGIPGIPSSLKASQSLSQGSAATTTKFNQILTAVYSDLEKAKGKIMMQFGGEMDDVGERNVTRAYFIDSFVVVTKKSSSDGTAAGDACETLQLSGKGTLHIL